jgi:hypothetical protein
MRRMRPVKKVLPALFATIVLGGLVLAFLDLRPAELGEGILERLSDLAPGGVALALACYGTSYFGRAIRFSVLMPGLRGLVHLASIAGRHNFLNLVLPFRTGELALPWMLRRESGRSLAEGGAALLVCRVLDLFCVAAYLSVGLAWYGLGSDSAEEVAPRVGAVLGALALGLALMGPIARQVSARLGPDASGKLRGFVARAAGHLGALSSGRLLAAAAVSLVTWFFTYATFYFLVRGMAGSDPIGQELGQIGFARSLVGTTGLHLSTVLPVNTVGGFGSWELGWISGYTLLAGVGKEAAGISAVVSHLVIFAFISLIGGLGFLLRKPPLDGAPGAGPGERAGDGAGDGSRDGSGDGEGGAPGDPQQSTPAA